MPSSPLWRGPDRRDHPPDPHPPGSRPAARRRRRRLTVTLGIVLLLAAASSVLLARAGDRAAEPEPGARSRLGYGAGADEQDRTSRYPRVGAGSFAVAGDGSPVRGEEGPVTRYRVAVEQGTGQDPDAFAADVDAVLADPRSWIGSGGLRVQRVAGAVPADFTIYLATPLTSEAMCAEGGLSTEGYTSCRLPGRVIINLARWLEAVPDYGAPIEVYRAYVINHEVGHEFGEGHEACPAPGRPAPVMQQQTYGLDGCLPNPWPILDGHHYSGDLVD
ncbi:DUF3152 domain-containing protein [Micromonospora sp. WMMD1082]|uniref:DUF3152 domain-containing protein n=1 Tax=Micromonospora sp. WMMD1082 TaxID=3016104 RepID=UPI002416BDCF|nr:DUF3152 domain-containing protein [Micromonospora sp. WMMD1082]MDG4794087.1 DUF3152 domain-containing protein [Micromonospora sp. WMMD1082]